jgi:2-polyprenyl-3-methyl-5-hydroxy-6-metoxy-1,4-benzoquinol methylase
MSSLTSSTFWDSWWPGKIALSELKADDFQYGRNGFFLRLMRRKLGSLDGIQVVELGGACSLVLLALAKWHGAKVTAIDYSPEGLDLTKRLFQANRCPVELIEADFLNWRPAGKYDVVTHYGVLEHFTDPAPLVRISADLLSPGGKLFLSMPNMRALGACFWRKWSPELWSKHIYHSDLAIRKACSEAGLRVRDTFHFGKPMVQQCPWERGGRLQSVVTFGQRVADQTGELPILDRGMGWISAHRGFLISQAAE